MNYFRFFGTTNSEVCNRKTISFHKKKSDVSAYMLKKKRNILKLINHFKDEVIIEVIIMLNS